MSKVKPFTKVNMKTVRNKFQKDLDKICKKHGFESVVLGNIRYTELEFTSKITVRLPVTNDKGNKVSHEQAEFTKHASRFGYKPSDFGKVVVTNYSNTKYRLVSLNPRRHKYPIIVESLTNNKRYIFPQDTLNFVMKGVR